MPVKALDAVALLQDRPDLGLVRGQLGTAVEQLEDGVWEIEFDNGQGQAFKFARLRDADLLVLRTEPATA